MRRWNKCVALLLTLSLWFSGMLCSYAEEESISGNNLLKATYETVKSVPITEEEVGEVMESVSDNSIAALSLPQENPVIQLEVPTQLPFMIDPYEIAGAGQIYSADFLITNKSTFPVDIDITKISYTLNDESIKPSGEPIPADTTSTEKDIYLFLKWAEKKIGDSGVIVNDYVDDSRVAANREDIITSEEGWQPRVIHLEPGADIMFTLDGSVNAMAENPWKQKDISIELAYTCGTEIEKKKSVSENALTVSENMVTVSENTAESVSENKTEDTSISENTVSQTNKEEDAVEGTDNSLPDANSTEEETKAPASTPITPETATPPTSGTVTTPATSQETITPPQTKLSDTEKADNTSTSDKAGISADANAETTHGRTKPGVDAATSE